MAVKDFADCFAEVVRRSRKQKGFSQEQLAENANLSSKMVSLIERKERVPSITVADRIARGLATPLWHLVKETEDLCRKNSDKRRK